MPAADTSWTKLPRRAAALAARLGLDRYGAWCWLLSHAAYADIPDPSWGALREGEVAVSTRRLAEAWGVGHHAARAILSDLVEAGLAEVVRKAVGASGGQVLRVKQGTFHGTFEGTFLNSENKGLATMKKTNQGTFHGTFPGRARVRGNTSSEEFFKRSARARALPQYGSSAPDYSHIRTAPEILALGHKAEQAGEAEK